MTVEKAIWAMQFYKEKLCNGIFNRYIDAFDVAITALRAQRERERGEPLTLEQLREMATQKPVVVWVVCVEPYSGEPIPDTGDWEMFDGYMFVGADIKDSYQSYGRTFLAYDHQLELPKKYQEE